jgi:hypothetical protein
MIKKLSDKLRSNKDKLLISNVVMLTLNKTLLDYPSKTRKKLKRELNIVASIWTTSRALHKMGWRSIFSTFIFELIYL